MGSPVEVFQLLQSAENFQIAVKQSLIVDFMGEDSQATTFHKQSLDGRIGEKSDQGFVQG